MTEDETYKVLKGLTRAEAEKMYEYFYQLGMDSPETVTIGDVTDFVDKKLSRYGWSSQKVWGLV